jgi:hypothetical protein
MHFLQREVILVLTSSYKKDLLIRVSEYTAQRFCFLSQNYEFVIDITHLKNSIRVRKGS